MNSKQIMPRQNPEEEYKGKCIDCGINYTVPIPEEQFMYRKGLYMPKRCEECRRKRRAQKYERQ